MAQDAIFVSTGLWIPTFMVACVFLFVYDSVNDDDVCVCVFMALW